MFEKRGGFVLLLLVSLSFVFVPFVSATGVTLTSVNSTYAQISVTDADNLYAYEVAFDYIGSPGSVEFSGFLGGSTTSGTDNDGVSVYSAYESRLDSGQTGISGAGELFNVSYSGTLSLRYGFFINATGAEEFVTYNSSAESPSGGGSGGGSGSSQEVNEANDTLSLIIVPDELRETLIVGDTVTREIVVANQDDRSGIVDVVLGELSGLVVPQITQLALDALEQERFSVVIGPLERPVIGTLFFQTGGLTVFELPVILDVRSENFLFDASISLGEAYRTINVGENIRAQIDLLQVGPDLKVDVTANYVVKDFAGNVYLEESETFFVEGSKDFVRDFQTSDLPAGEYVLTLEILYPDAFATSSTRFIVVEEAFNLNVILIVLVIVALFVIIFSAFWYGKTRERLRHKHVAQ